VSTDYIPPPLTTGGVTMAGRQPAPMPVMPNIPASRTVVNRNAPGAGRDAAILRRSDPAEITGRIQQIFSNLGASLATSGPDGVTEQERLARLTREVQAGRSFDDLRRSAGIIAGQNQRPVPLDELAPATPAEYPTTPLPLSPEVQRMLDQRFFDANQAVVRAAADKDYTGNVARTQAALQMVDVERWAQQNELENRRRLAARGVARSPMFANPAQRQVFEQANRAGSEVRMNLNTTLAELDRALRAAESQREAVERELSIEEGVARSDVNRLLGAS
jgi:hypothetical protein